MRLPESVRESLDAALERRGLGPVRSIDPVGGGCVTETGRIRTASGESFFLKWTAGDHPVGLFTAEARSLAALAATGAIRVPAALEVHDGEPGEGDVAGARWLLLEWLEPGAVAAHTWPALGQGLVALHRRGAPHAGWPQDNFIGTLPQPNAAARDWASFFRERRLLPQLERARAGGRFDPAELSRFDRLLERLEEELAAAAPDGASLLHGDLWSGNLHVQQSGDPALIDPSCYFGHREVDLAMSRLFGGFDALFYAAYEEAWPLLPDHERRLHVYQLYYLLVHVNLFGGAYRARCLAALSALGL